MAAALIAGILSQMLSNVGYTFGVLAGLLILCGTLLYQGLLCSDTTKSSPDYFGAQSHLSSLSTLQSLGTTWIMLGNVVVANMFLGQTFGILTFWVIITWAWAFALASYRVPRIRDVLGPEDTLHSFLHDAYSSRSMRLVAALITVVVGIGVFSVEIAAGAGLFIAILPTPQGGYIVPIVVILIVMSMAAGVILGGLKAVIQSDSSFYYIIMLSMTLFAAITYMLWAFPDTQKTVSVPAWLPTEIDSIDIVVFLCGIFALQVPLLLGDFGTWQRIKATDANEKKSLSALMFKQAGAQSYLWGVPVIAGIVIATWPKIGELRAGNLYPSSTPLIEFVRTWIEFGAVSTFVRAFALTLLVIGLVAVMITTANSYLMVAMEAWVHDFQPTKRAPERASRESKPPDVQKARTLCVAFALVACLPVALIVATGVSILPIVVVVFGAQVALAPAAVLALYFPEAAAKLGKMVSASTLAAFAASLIFGFVVTYAPTSKWWADYGAYLSPIIALAVPTIAIILSLVISTRSLRPCGAFLWKLVVPRD